MPVLLPLLLSAWVHAAEPSVPQIEPYRAFVKAQNDDPEAIAEEARLQLAGFVFYRVGDPWAARLRAGVAPDGTLVGREHPAGWRKLLEAGDAAAVAERVQWLVGNPMPVLPDTTFPDPGAQARVHPPSLTRRADGALELRLWVMYPPNTREPFLVRVVAPPSGPGTLEELPWTSAP